MEFASEERVERSILKLLSTVPVYLSTSCQGQHDQVLHFLPKLWNAVLRLYLSVLVVLCEPSLV